MANFAVETPLESGRIRDFQLIPPPGGNAENQVLVWNPTLQQPEWRNAADLNITVTPAPSYAPLVADDGKWLTTDTGARLVGTVS